MGNAVAPSQPLLVAGKGINSMAAARTQVPLGGSDKAAGLDRRVIRARMLEELASKVVK